MPATPTRTLILGIGNTLLSDDGVGNHVIQRLQHDYPDCPDAEFVDGGTLSFTLALPVAEATALVVVDAANLGAAPGTLQLFEGAAMDRFLATGTQRSVHEVGLIDLMALAHLTDTLPPRRALIAIQPAATGWGEQPSAAVAAAIPAACDLAMRLVRQWS